MFNVYFLLWGVCWIMLFMISVVNSVIGINDSYWIMILGNCIFEIMIKGIIWINSVMILYNKISINMFIWVIIVLLLFLMLLKLWL